VTSTLRQWLLRQAYDPSYIGVLVNPFYLTRRALARAMRRLAPHVQGRVLDVGCGQKPYMGMLSVSSYTGLEIDTPENRRSKRADAFYDGTHFPFAEGEFDSVLCNQVLEHVFEPDLFVAELHRVLKPGGTLVLTVPFVWDEHEQPYDYARYSSFGLRHLLSKHGFVLDEQIKTLPDIAVLHQLLNAYLYKVLLTRSRVVNLLVTAILMAPVSCAGLLLGRILPNNADLYLDNVVLARKSSAPGKTA
jgi:SAM-dependent methyltransferase